MQPLGSGAPESDPVSGPRDTRSAQSDGRDGDETPQHRVTEEGKGQAVAGGNSGQEGLTLTAVSRMTPPLGTTIPSSTLD